MTIQTKYEFQCEVCEKKFTSTSREEAERKAKQCELSHEIVYVPMLKSDIQRLLAFLVSGDEELITPTLWRTIRAYRSLK